MMTMRNGYFCLLGCAAVTLIACERNWRDYGARSEAKQSSPQYTTVAHVAKMPHPANIESVAPKGALDGQALYGQSCMACHQATGQGIPGAFPPLDGSRYVLSDNVERLAAIAIYGLQGPIKVGDNVFNGVMAPWGHFKDEQLAAIVTYVRGSWSNKASPVDASVFAETRKKYGQRGPFSISELGEEYVN